MRSTVIPAQITTVEDKIAGNFNLAQILLMMAPVLIATLLYTIIPTHMSFGKGKIIFTIISAVVFLTLAIRVKSKIIGEWLVVWLRFKLRPEIYVFDKNDNYLRPVFVKEKDKVEVKIKAVDKVVVKETVSDEDKVRWQNIIEGRNKSLSFEFNQKGGLHVALETRQG